MINYRTAREMWTPTAKVVPIRPVDQVYARMSDAELDYEALKRARDEVFADAQQAAIEMQQAQTRMNRHLERHAQLKRQIEAAEVLLGATRGALDVSEKNRG